MKGLKLYFSGTLWTKIKIALNFIITGTFLLSPRDEEFLHQLIHQKKRNPTAHPPEPSTPSSAFPELHLLQFTDRGNPVYIPYHFLRKDGVYHE